MKQPKLKKKALAISIACALALSTAPQLHGLAYAANDGSPQATSEPAKAADSEQAPAAGSVANSGKPGYEEYDLPAVTVEAKRPDWESKLSPGTVTVIRPSDYKGEQKTLPELLKDVPGVHVRYLNGKGQYTTVSIRGSTAAQVGVFVDGVLVNLGGDAAVDISTIPVKNVERIEVYRGYIPARFGGTYIGGVINIVTKRPTKENITASMGKSSYGGYKGSLQIDEPLGSGSLMVGINREQSKGDFKYKNYNNYESVASLDQLIANDRNQIDNAYKDACRYTFSAVGATEINGHTLEYYQNNLEEWHTYLSTTDASGNLLLYNLAHDSAVAKTPSPSVSKIGSMIYRLSDYNAGNNANYAYAKSQMTAGELTLISPILDTLTSSERNAYIQKLIADGYNDDLMAIYYKIAANSIVGYKARADKTVAVAEEDIAKLEAKKKILGDGERWRRYNDYKNTDVLVKWQDDHWLAKVSWKQIDRHLPRGLLWYHSPAPGIDTDILDYCNAQTKQKLTSREALVGRRDTAGKLEWGWSFNYLDQDKRYRCENWELLDALNPNNMYSQIPMRKWSAFDSNRWGGGIDGSYKAGDNHLVEFLVNWSTENMDVAGSRITDGTLETGYSSANRYRTGYEQKLFNVQLQDTITLNEKGDFWFTPSIRYNQSEIHSGNAVGYEQNKDKPNKWMFAAIDQQDNKVTWQLALKKQVNDKLTLRSTYGTYYRLLNLYEIAGDGGGILPAPIASNNQVQGLNFPRPEEGRQFDVSAIWDGRTFGADSKLQLTCFYRKSENLLMLWRHGYDYWSYTNSARGDARGVELQAGFSWEKWDLNLTATYLNTHAEKWDDSPTGLNTPRKITQPYTPEWEGSVRLAYRPDDKTMFFGEFKYVGEMCTSNELCANGVVQDVLTTLGLGAKHRFNEKFELVVGCNDIFNHGPKLKCRYRTSSGREVYATNTEYPLQGRTYYATVNYNF